VLNPAILPDGLQHGQYLQITLAMLEQADAIFLLNGWEKSKGATREFDRACELGLLFLYQDWESVMPFCANATACGGGSCIAYQAASSRMGHPSHLVLPR
jgi:hypothetical protein